MAPMPAMHQEMHNGTCKQEEIGEHAKHMRAMFSEQKKTSDEKETNAYPLYFCQMPLGAVVLISAVHVKAFS
jgi:hypothetical protein